MGALHEGHLALLRAAPRAVRPWWSCSLFVNPAQFDERSDLERYPRDEARRRALAPRSRRRSAVRAGRRGGLPAPASPRASRCSGVSERLEGEARGSEHFRGVATVVTKLLCMALPDVAYFGQKDAQQLLVIRRLVADLNLPVRIEAVPTVREPDGLAMSSRNALLSRRERAQRARRCPRRSRAAQRARRARASARRRRCSTPRARALTRTTGRARVRRARRPRHASSRSRSSSGEALLAVAARIGAGAPDRQRGAAAGRAGARAAKPTKERRSAHAARDAQVQDPPRDGQRLRPALRGLDHDRPGPARGGRHPRARAGARRRRRQRRALRDLHDRRRARIGRDAA